MKRYKDKKTGEIVTASEYRGGGSFVRVEHEAGRVTIEYPKDFEKQYRLLREDLNDTNRGLCLQSNRNQ